MDSSSADIAVNIDANVNDVELMESPSPSPSPAETEKEVASKNRRHVLNLKYQAPRIKLTIQTKES